MKIAPMRTLEQKISDAGPGGQRVDPLVLSKARKSLQQAGVLAVEYRGDTPWYRLATTPEAEWRARLALVGPILDKLNETTNNRGIGKAFEIAVFKALREESSRLDWPYFLGGFRNTGDLNEGAWQKVEPPAMISGRSLSGDRKLDFVLIHPSAGPAGIEVKNTREWLYPDKDRMLDLLAKCCELDAVPVMVCRRYAYVTFSVLHRCGVLLYQNYNQILPESLRPVAEQARDKNLLGYHDIRIGTEPGSRLRRFIGLLPDLLPEARERFDAYKDLLEAFSSGQMPYREFAARSRRREQGLPEDSDSDPQAE